MSEDLRQAQDAMEGRLVKLAGGDEQARELSAWAQTHLPPEARRNYQRLLRDPEAAPGVVHAIKQRREQWQRQREVDASAARGGAASSDDFKAAMARYQAASEAGKPADARDISILARTHNDIQRGDARASEDS